MKRILIAFVIVFFTSGLALAAETPKGAPDESAVINKVNALPPDAYYLGRVLKETGVKQDAIFDTSNVTQEVAVELMEGPEKGQVRKVDNQGLTDAKDPKAVSRGDTVIVQESHTLEGTVYSVSDRYRLPPMAWMAAFFVVLVLLMSGWRGLGAILGLFISIGVLAKFMVPAIIHGGNPLMISLAAAVFIGLVSLYVAHGFNRRTSIAVVSTLITLVVSVGMAVLFVSAAKLFGTGSEEAFILQLTPLGKINLKGLLLGGIIIGSLGVLDDITTAQTAAVEELHKLHPSQTFRDLYRRGLSIGREHISSLVNTLALAYVGASLPLFILFQLGDAQPLWMVLNSEFIAEEIVRTLVGSSSLVLAVPISTAFAAYVYSRKRHGYANI